MAEPGRPTAIPEINVVDDISKVFSVLSSELINLSEWKFLMRRLDLTNEDICDIEIKFTNDGRREVIYQCLLRWQARLGEGATIVKLVRALLEEKLKKAAEIIKTYSIRTPCNRCPGGHDASNNLVSPPTLTRQKTKLKPLKHKHKYPSSIPKLPKIYSPTSSIGSIGSRRHSTGKLSSRSSGSHKSPKRRARTMSTDSSVSITSSTFTTDDNESDGADEPVNCEEVVRQSPEIVEPEPEIPEEPRPQTPEEPRSKTPEMKPEVVHIQPEVVSRQMTPSPRLLTPYNLQGHLQVKELIPDGGIPQNFADLFKEMCSHLYKTIVRNADDNARALAEIINLKNFFVRHLVVGSVIIGMECHGEESYQGLKTMYENGKLLNACHRVFARENLLRHLGLQLVRYSLYIDEFEGGRPPPEETLAPPVVPEVEEKKPEEEENNDETESTKEEPPGKLKREKTTIPVTVEVCARLTAHIDTDIPSRSLLQSNAESGFRAANAKKYYRVITRDDVMNPAIMQMNEAVSIPGLKFTRLDLKKSRVDVVMTCCSQKAIDDAYALFLRRQLLKICNEILLTKKIKKEANVELIQLEVEIADEHITKCEKNYKEQLKKIKMTRALEREGTRIKTGKLDREGTKMKLNGTSERENTKLNSTWEREKTNMAANRKLDNAHARGRLGSSDSSDSRVTSREGRLNSGSSVSSRKYSR